MAIRVTATEVLEIMDNCTVEESVVDSIIIAANAIIDKVFEGDATVGTTLLKEMERWLTAHMIASTLSRMASVEKLGEAEITYTGKWGEKLNSTPYGQVVLTMDPTGKMAKAGRAGASIYAVPNFDE